MAETPPGWYPDPEQPSRKRYWDGEGWTGEVHAGEVEIAAARHTPAPPAGIAGGEGESALLDEVRALRKEVTRVASYVRASLWLVLLGLVGLLVLILDNADSV